MALSRNNHFSQSGGLDPPSDATSPPLTSHNQPTNTSAAKLWSQFTAKRGRQVRHSLVQTTATSSSPSQNDPLKKKSNIWRSGNGPNSVFIDMSGQKEGRSDFLRLIAQQYPSRVGVVLQQAGNLRFAEISFDEEDPEVITFLEKGLRLDNDSIIFPCRALESQMEIISVRLSKLPLLSESKLLSGLKESLSPFGRILDVEPEHKTFMGNGFAILDVSKKNEALSPLTHLIPWIRNKEQAFHAVWSKMPKYCKYCHEEGHSVADCPTRQKKFSCWNCNETGHLSKSCPRRTSPAKKPKGSVSPPKPFTFANSNDNFQSSSIVQNHTTKRRRVREVGMYSQVEGFTFINNAVKDASIALNGSPVADFKSDSSDAANMSNPQEPSETQGPTDSRDTPDSQGLPDTQGSLRESQLDSQLAAIHRQFSGTGYDVDVDEEMSEENLNQHSSGISDNTMNPAPQPSPSPLTSSYLDGQGRFPYTDQ